MLIFFTSKEALKINIDMVAKIDATEHAYQTIASKSA